MDAQLAFAKLSATGNDFILIDNRNGVLQGDETAFLRRICRRRTGVGADGVLLIETSLHADFRMRYYNADGCEAAMCGNGARAAAFYAFHHGMAPIHCRMEISGELYEAIVEGRAVSLLLKEPADVRLQPGVLQDPALREGGTATLGVPHYVLFADDVATLDVEKLGKHYCEHDYFKPERTNVDFVARKALNALEIRTYERGVDTETLACGTGAVVAAYIARDTLDMSFPIELQTRGGTLTVSIDEKSGRPLLHGEVGIPFKGTVFSKAFSTERI